VLEILGVHIYGSPTSGSLPLHHTVLQTLPIFRSPDKLSSDISVLIQCPYSALIVLIQFGRFISLFRVLVESKNVQPSNGSAIGSQKIVSRSNG